MSNFVGQFHLHLDFHFLCILVRIFVLKIICSQFISFAVHFGFNLTLKIFLVYVIFCSFSSQYTFHIDFCYGPILLICKSPSCSIQLNFKSNRPKHSVGISYSMCYPSIHNFTAPYHIKISSLDPNNFTFLFFRFFSP